MVAMLFRSCALSGRYRRLMIHFHDILPWITAKIISALLFYGLRAQMSEQHDRAHANHLFSYTSAVPYTFIGEILESSSASVINCRAENKSALGTEQQSSRLKLKQLKRVVPRKCDSFVVESRQSSKGNSNKSCTIIQKNYPLRKTFRIA